jgi:hypothetical protein
MRDGPQVDNETVNLQRIHRDERGIVISWLVKILVALAIAGVVLLDAGSIVVNYFSVQDTANQVAVAVAAEVGAGASVVPNLRCTRRSADGPCKAAFEIARDEGVRITSATFDQQGVFHVEIKKTADTLVVGRIGAIESWATVTATAEAGSD